MPSAALGPPNISSLSARISANAVASEDPLRLGDRSRRPGEDALAQRRDGCGHVIGDVRHETDLTRVGRVELLPGQHRSGDLAGRHPSQDRDGDDRSGDADADLGEREGDRAVDDDEVARRHQADAAGTHRALYGGDRRARCVHQPLQHGHHRTRVGRAAERSALLEVRAGAERSAVVSQDDCTGAAVDCRLELGGQLAQQLLRECVAVVLRVERDGGDAALDV
jgi:hypothetical protein